MVWGRGRAGDLVLREVAAKCEGGVGKADRDVNEKLGEGEIFESGGGRRADDGPGTGDLVGRPRSENEGFDGGELRRREKDRDPSCFSWLISTFRFMDLRKGSAVASLSSVELRSKWDKLDDRGVR